MGNTLWRFILSGLHCTIIILHFKSPISYSTLLSWWVFILWPLLCCARDLLFWSPIFTEFQACQLCFVFRFSICLVWFSLCISGIRSFLIHHLMALSLRMFVVVCLFLFSEIIFFFGLLYTLLWLTFSYSFCFVLPPSRTKILEWKAILDGPTLLHFIFQTPTCACHFRSLPVAADRTLLFFSVLSKATFLTSSSTSSLYCSVFIYRFLFRFRFVLNSLFCTSTRAQAAGRFRRSVHFR